MKKLFLSFSVASLLFFSSCGDNENTVNPQPIGTATITGTVFADFDYTNEDYETVNNQKVIAWIYDVDTEDYYIVETTTDDEGNYTLEIKVGNRPVGVEIQLADFKATVKYADDDSEEETFYGDEFYTGVEYAVKGGEYIRDMYYND